MGVEVSYINSNIDIIKCIVKQFMYLCGLDTFLLSFTGVQHMIVCIKRMQRLNSQFTL